MQEFIDKLPTELQEAAKVEFGKYVKIDSKETATKLFRDHPVVKSAYDAEISYTAANIERRYQEEKLPKIIEERLAAEKSKLTKTPEMIELEKMRAEMAADKKALALEKQRGRALAKAQELDVPATLLERYIGETDEATDEGINKLVEALKPWADNREKKIRESLLGNSQTPDAGRNPNAKTMPRADFDKLDPAGQMAAIRAKTVIQ